VSERRSDVVLGCVLVGLKSLQMAELQHQSRNETFTTSDRVEQRNSVNPKMRQERHIGQRDTERTIRKSNRLFELSFELVSRFCPFQSTSTEEISPNESESVRMQTPEETSQILI
jgi:hypothetical protein